MERALRIGYVLAIFLLFTGSATADWQQTFGGEAPDGGNYFQQTSDGGYIIVGTTESYGAGTGDLWLIKTDANGAKQWDKTFGGPNYDRGYCVQQTADGGYVIAGFFGGIPYGAPHGAWLIRTDANGNMQWEKVFTEAGGNTLGVVQAADGGYVLAGVTSRSDILLGSDIMLIKTDANGTVEWEKQLGEPGTEHMETAWSLQLTADGGYIIAGSVCALETFSFEGLLMKTDAEGNQVWSKTFAGIIEFPTEFSSVKQTANGGYVVTGWTGEPVWLVKTDASGNEEWNRTFDSLGRSQGFSVLQTTEGDYVIAGWAYRDDYSHYAFLKKVNADGFELWNRTFPGDLGANCVQQATDGSYVIVGEAETGTPESSNIDVMLANTLADLTQTSPVSPADKVVLSTPPTFEWMPDGGMDNAFAVDFSLSSSFRKSWSTYTNLHQTIHGFTWQMPKSAWNKVPYGKTVYWRVRGMDLDHEPRTVIISDPIRSFFKQQ